MRKLALFFAVILIVGCDKKHADGTTVGKEYSDSLAFSNIYFGMEKPQVDSLIDSVYYLGEYKFHLTPKFGFNEKLISIVLQSHPIEIDEFGLASEFFSNAIESAIAPIEMKYGDYENPSDVSTDRIIVAEWKRGTKLIQVGTYTHPNGKRSINCWISDKRFISDDSIFVVKYKDSLYQKQKDNF